MKVENSLIELNQLQWLTFPSFYRSFFVEIKHQWSSHTAKRTVGVLLGSAAGTWNLCEECSVRVTHVSDQIGSVMSFYFQQDTHARTHTQLRPPGVAGVRAEAADGAGTVSGSALHQQRAHRDTFLPPLGFICVALFWKLAAGDGAWSGRVFHLDNMLYSWIPAVWIPAVALLFGFQGKGWFHSLMSCAGVRKLRSWGEITATVEGFCFADSRCEGMWRDRDPTQCTDRSRGPVSWCPVLHGRVQLQHVECACVRACV